ncbi:MAG: flagellar protein FliT [Lachnospiraceae bacterium]|nr:flagellar protein FliT [Lachnospiraceae bacterium]
MENGREYLSILTESLKKKITILDEILLLNQKQLESVSGNEIDDNLFNEVIEKKDIYIKEINNLDKGFEQVYERIKSEITGNTDKYSGEIVELKQLISQITEKSMKVQLSEKRNKQAVLKKMNEEKTKIHQTRNANKVASNYYNNMNKVNYVEPQFMDKKK